MLCDKYLIIYTQYVLNISVAIHILNAEFTIYLLTTSFVIAVLNIYATSEISYRICVIRITFGKHLNFTSLRTVSARIVLIVLYPMK